MRACPARCTLTHSMLHRHAGCHLSPALIDRMCMCMCLQEYYDLVPGGYGLAYEDVWLESEDGTKLHGWMLWLKEWDAPARATRPVIMFFQENAGACGWAPSRASTCMHCYAGPHSHVPPPPPKGSCSLSVCVATHAVHMLHARCADPLRMQIAPSRFLACMKPPLSRVSIRFRSGRHRCPVPLPPQGR